MHAGLLRPDSAPAPAFDEAASVAAELAARGVTSFAEAADVTDPAAVPAFVERAHEG